MAKVSPYIMFDGNCREAMEFYKECLGGELFVQTFGDSPMAEQTPEAMRDNVMHAALTNDRMMFMASDAMAGADVKIGNNVVVCLICDTAEELKTYFAKLSAGGKVGNDIREEFFGTYADLQDKFGINWMLQYSPENAQS